MEMMCIYPQAGICKATSSFKVSGLVFTYITDLYNSAWIAFYYYWYNYRKPFLQLTHPDAANPTINELVSSKLGFAFAIILNLTTHLSLSLFLPLPLTPSPSLSPSLFLPPPPSPSPSPSSSPSLCSCRSYD